MGKEAQSIIDFNSRIKEEPGNNLLNLKCSSHFQTPTKINFVEMVTKELVD